MEEKRNIKEMYKLWMENAIHDPDLLSELKKMGDDETEDAFYKDLSFGTGGLRGKIGAGTNRMNLYTVARASQGVSGYLLRSHSERGLTAVIAYDSRNKSEWFSKAAAGIFASKGMKVYLYKELMPTPCLSFAVRRLKGNVGVMITASHNPAEYNGYKVYRSDGCQITVKEADEIQQEIQNIAFFEDIDPNGFQDGIKSGRIEYISEDLYTEYIEMVKKHAVSGYPVDKNLSIIYTPLNGAGLKPVVRILKECGFANMKLVKEQEQPDGNFPYCPYPNPEAASAMELGLSYCKTFGADLLLATDPDCDRAGAAVKDKDGEYRCLTADETGILLLDFICSQKIRQGVMPENPIFIQTIVTTDLAETIAAHYGVKTIHTLTGFKFIGEQIGRLEQEGREGDFIFGFEESGGYLSGSYVRDKDGVNAALLICEMSAYYKGQGITLPERLDELYQTYGYCGKFSCSFTFEGKAGFEKMKQIMNRLRQGVDRLGDQEICSVCDYMNEVDGLPASDVIKFHLERGSSVIVRPSGTEPKLKVYITVRGSDKNRVHFVKDGILEDLKQWFD